MACEISLREIELIEEIATLRDTKRKLVETRDKLASIHLEQYSVDSGQVRQFAIYQRLSQVNTTIDKIDSEIAALKTELESLNGGGGMATIVIPAF